MDLLRSLNRAYISAHQKISRKQIQEASKSSGTSHVSRLRSTPFPKNMQMSFASVPEFLSSNLTPKGTISVWLQGLPIDMSVSPVIGEPLIVILHGAADPTVKLPWLSGAGVMKDLKASRLSISDPSLYLDESLGLSWFAGNQYQPNLVEALVKLIQHVKKKLNASKVILFGGSGGGFAALRIAPLIPNCTAVVMNPQTDIEKYHQMHVDRYVKIAWADSRALMHQAIETNVIQSIEKHRANFDLYYIQNYNDTFHSRVHMAPFCKAFEGVENFYLLRDKWKAGHTPPPKELIVRILSTALLDSPYSDMKTLGFIPI